MSKGDWDVEPSSLLLPPFAGPDDPAVFIGGGADTPAELVAYYAPSNRVIRGFLIFRADSQNYIYFVNAYSTVDFINSVRVGRCEAGVVKEMWQWLYGGGLGDRIQTTDAIGATVVDWIQSLNGGTFTMIGASQFNLQADGGAPNLGVINADDLSVNTNAGAVYLPAEPIYITATNAAWPVPDGIRGGWVELQAGGGAGGGANATGAATCASGPGGGYGARALRFYTAAELGATVNIQLGAAGTGAAGGTGSDAADSSFDPAGTGPTLTCQGGKAPASIPAAAGTANITGAGGTQPTATGGTINIDGENGDACFRLDTAVSAGGAGKSGKWGEGGRAGNANSAGNNATGYGAGGGGARNGNSQAARAGGDGAPPLCVFIPAA